MDRAYFRFYASLNDFLPADQRQQTIVYALNGPVAVKHPIESLGVPHPEVSLILARGSPVDFFHKVATGDRISVFPALTEIESEASTLLRPPLSYPPAFILDGHLGQLSTYLRLLGFDALYDGNFDDEELARLSHDEGRILLTRDRRLLMRKIVTYGYWLRSKEPGEQIQEVLRRYQLQAFINPWHRCLRCNGVLETVSKETILDRLEPLTRKYYHDFHMCRECQQIYWKGSHFEPLERLVEEVVGELNSTRPRSETTGG